MKMFWNVFAIAANILSLLFMVYALYQALVLENAVEATFSLVFATLLAIQSNSLSK